jgi:hypothetical protein
MTMTSSRYQVITDVGDRSGHWPVIATSGMGAIARLNRVS